MLQKNSAFVALLSRFSAAAPGWTATVQQTQKPWVPETKGQLKTLYQFTSIKTGAAIHTTLAIAAGLVKSSSSSSSRSGSCESASKKQRTADTRDVTYLAAAAFAHEDKTDVPYRADALKEQQLYKLAKVAKKLLQLKKEKRKKKRRKRRRRRSSGRKLRTKKRRKRRRRRSSGRKKS
jgi:hypothetical protein